MCLPLKHRLLWEEVGSASGYAVLANLLQAAPKTTFFFAASLLAIVDHIFLLPKYTLSNQKYL